MTRTSKPLGDVLRFLGLTLLFSWGVGAPWVVAPVAMERLAGPFVESPAFLVAGWAPTLAAVLLTLLREGWRGLGRLGLSMIDYRPPWLMLIAFVILPAIAAGLALWAHDQTALRRVLLHTPLILFGTAQILTNTGPLGEEAGWRGYALPRLLQRWSPLTAGLVLGLVWTLWHVPAMFIGGIVSSGLEDLGWYALATVGLSLVMTWLFVRSQGSVLIAGIIPHFVINGMGRTGAWASRPEEAVALFAVGAVLILDAWRIGRRFKRD